MWKKCHRNGKHRNPEDSCRNMQPRQGEGGDRRGGEDRGKLVGTPSSAGLGPSRRSCTTTDSAR